MSKHGDTSGGTAAEMQRVMKTWVFRALPTPVATSTSQRRLAGDWTKSEGWGVNGRRRRCGLFLIKDISPRQKDINADEMSPGRRRGSPTAEQVSQIASLMSRTAKQKQKFTRKWHCRIAASPKASNARRAHPNALVSVE